MSIDPQALAIPLAGLGRAHVAIVGGKNASLGVDRDSAELAGLFDERDEAVSWMIRSVIGTASREHARVGLCGQAPSDRPEVAKLLVECGIDSISVTPDSFLAVKRHVAAAERAAVPHAARAPVVQAGTGT